VRYNGSRGVGCVRLSACPDAQAPGWLVQPSEPRPLRLLPGHRRLVLDHRRHGRHGGGRGGPGRHVQPRKPRALGLLYPGKQLTRQVIALVAGRRQRRKLGSVVGHVRHGRGSAAPGGSIQPGQPRPPGLLPGCLASDDRGGGARLLTPRWRVKPRQPLALGSLLGRQARRRLALRRCRRGPRGRVQLGEVLAGQPRALGLLSPGKQEARLVVARATGLLQRSSVPGLASQGRGRLATGGGVEPRQPRPLGLLVIGHGRLVLVDPRRDRRHPRHGAARRDGRRRQPHPRGRWRRTGGAGDPRAALAPRRPVLARQPRPLGLLLAQLGWMRSRCRRAEHGWWLSRRGRVITHRRPTAALAPRGLFEAREPGQLGLLLRGHGRVWCCRVRVANRRVAQFGRPLLERLVELLLSLQHLFRHDLHVTLDDAILLVGVGGGGLGGLDRRVGGHLGLRHPRVAHRLCVLHLPLQSCDLRICRDERNRLGGRGHGKNAASDDAGVDAGSGRDVKDGCGHHLQLPLSQPSLGGRGLRLGRFHLGQELSLQRAGSGWGLS